MRDDEWVIFDVGQQRKVVFKLKSSRNYEQNPYKKLIVIRAKPKHVPAS